MVAIQNFFASIGDTIVSCFDFLLSWIRDWIGILRLLTKLPSIITACISWFPVELLYPFGILLSIIIVYKIVGREG